MKLSKGVAKRLFPGAFYMVEISAIIRSAGDGKRGAAFKRAVQSIVSQRGVAVDCIIVFNGGSCDADLIAWAKAQRNTRCFVLERGDKAAATAFGRAAVRGEFFCFLDDDDEFLPGAFEFGVNLLLKSARAWDCAATNGFYVTPSGTRCVFPNAERFARTGYVESLLGSRNWLASGGAMFRSSTVSLCYFENLPRHREWTVIAYRLATTLNVQFVNRLTFRIHSTASSQSKLPSYYEAATEALESMLQWTKDPARSRALLRRMSDARRSMASYYRIHHDFRKAWRAYFSAVSTPGGLRHLPYGALLLSGDTRPVNEILNVWTRA